MAEVSHVHLRNFVVCAGVALIPTKIQRLASPFRIFKTDKKTFMYAY